MRRARWLMRFCCGCSGTIKARKIMADREGHNAEGKQMELTDRQFGYWRCLGPAGPRKWLCRCVCGQEKVVEEADLLAGVSKSCGCRRARSEDLRGRQFGSLTVVEPVPKRDRDNSVRWLCRCKCGEYTTVSSNKLKTGHTTSCGCGQMAGRETRTLVGGTCAEILFSEKLRKNNTSGHTGVSRRRNGWLAYITLGGKTRGLGIFPSYEEAVRAREKAEGEARDYVSACLEQARSQAAESFCGGEKTARLVEK